MRLIDADALSEKLCETTIFVKDGEAFQRMINDAPTVDAVEVVRCKDCIRNNDRNLCDIAYFINADGDGYCNCGERRGP